MILVDTSTWIDHFRSTHPGVVRYLLDGLVVVHPFILGELALGSLRRRDEVLELVAALPTVPLVSEEGVRGLAERYSLHGTGIGWVDAHLLATAHATGIRLLTSDKRLAEQARRLGLAV